MSNPSSAINTAAIVNSTPRDGAQPQHQILTWLQLARQPLIDPLQFPVEVFELVHSPGQQPAKVIAVKVFQRSWQFRSFILQAGCASLDSCSGI